MFELLVPPIQEQLARAGGDKTLYDRGIRPSLMVQAMKMLQHGEVEPDVWKLEGVETTEDSRKLAEQARGGGRDRVGLIVLGRGEDDEKVKHWLRTASKVPGFIGFAVGRTIFWDPLVGVKEGRLSREDAAQQVAQNYKGFCDLWMSA